jgi:hypothetical protein
LGCLAVALPEAYPSQAFNGQLQKADAAMPPSRNHAQPTTGMIHFIMIHGPCHAREPDQTKLNHVMPCHVDTSHDHGCECRPAAQLNSGWSTATSQATVSPEKELAAGSWHLACLLDSKFDCLTLLGRRQRQRQSQILHSRGIVWNFLLSILYFH